MRGKQGTFKGYERQWRPAIIRLVPVKYEPYDEKLQGPERMLYFVKYSKTMDVVCNVLIDEQEVKELQANDLYEVQIINSVLRT